MPVEIEKIARIYDYVSAGARAKDKADLAFIFGRADPLVAKKGAELILDEIVDHALVVGGIGKDSGALTRLQIPEAHYLASLMIGKYRVPGERIYVEPRPTNGGQCWEMGIETIVNLQLPHDKLKVVIHPTSLRRIMAMFGKVSERVKFKSELQGVGTEYQFNPANPVDQKEAAAELLRLADWPARGFCLAQSDLPLDLVEYARNLK